MCWVTLIPIRSNGKFKNSLFFIHFFNKDISFNIPCKFLKFDMHVDEGYLEGSLSQICYLGPSFFFMQSRKTNF